MRLAPIVGVVLVAVGGAAWFSYLRFGGSSAVVTTSGVGVFPSEYDAAYVGSASIKTAPALATLGQGESVSVLWDTYGKDYWVTKPYVKGIFYPPLIIPRLKYIQVEK